jgi:transposase
VARQLGFNRNSISDWFSKYETGGLAKMLEIGKPKGRETLIPEAAAEEIKKVLATEKGFRMYREIHELVVNKYETEICYSAVHKYVRYRLGAKPKSARASNPKKLSRGGRVQANISGNFGNESNRSEESEIYAGEDVEAG